MQNFNIKIKNKMKQIINNTKLAGLLAALTLALTSACTDYLDIMPDNVATMEHAFSNRNVARRFLYTCYNMLPNPTSLKDNPASVGGDEAWWCLDDANAGGLVYRESNAAYLAQGKQSANNPYLNYWDGSNNGKCLFRGIRDCNIFLENIHTPSDILIDERLQWISEVKVLKAYFHYYLLRLYGPVPIIRDNVPVNEATGAIHVYREPVDDVVEYIVELLDEAYPTLLDNSFETQSIDAGRITKPVCAAIKAEVLVWAASPLLNGSEEQAPTFSLIDNRGVQLFPQEYDPAKWTRAAQAVKEAIDICHLYGHKLFTYIPPSTGSALSQTTLLKGALRGAVTEKFNTEIVWPDTHDSNSLQNYSITYIDTYTAINFLGEFGPTLKMAEEFYTRNGLPIDEDEEWTNWVGSNFNQRYEPITVSTDAGSGINKVSSLAEDHLHNIASKDNSGAAVTAKLHFYREPRFYAWIGFDRGIWELNGKNDDNERFISGRGDEQMGYMSAGRHNPAGYQTKKLVSTKTIQEASGSITWYNDIRFTFPLIRLTGLYLLYAEALNESNPAPTEEVFKWIDMVRERAGVPPVKEAYQKAVSSKKSKPNTKSGMRDIIKKERRIELSFENARFYDLLRWKDAYQYWNEPVRGWNISRKAADEFYQVSIIYSGRIFNTRDYFWPLSISSLQVNNNLVQNPGW